MSLGIRAKISIFAAFAWVFIFGVFSIYIYMDKTGQTRMEAIKAASMLSKEITADRQLYTSTVVKRAIDAGIIEGGAYHNAEKTIPLPTAFLKDVAETLGDKSGFYIGIKSLYPINPDDGPSDDFQREALAYFVKGSDTNFYRFEDFKGKRSLRYMVPDMASSQTCVDCHNNNPSSLKRDYKIGDTMGGLEIVIPIENELAMAMSDVWRVIGWGFAVIVAMGFAGLAFIRRVVTDPVLNLADTTGYLAKGDLTSAATVASGDEIGRLGAQINDVVKNLHTMIEDIRRTSDASLDISARVRDMSRFVLEGSTNQGVSIDAIVANMEGVNTSISEIAGATDVLASSIEKGSSSVLELGAGVSEVMDNMESLFASVDDTVRSTGDMSFSIKEISENIENLSTAITQVSSSMGQINASIKEVESNASEAYRFSDDCIRAAKVGMDSVESTMHGIVKVKDITLESTNIIKSLCDRIKEIGKILDVIKDVSEETNLLAINAAIIAAQSGEHGKSFAVVANEIKELAERTSTSAKEVTEIIQGVDLESAKAGAVMQKGVQSVEEGVRLAVEAGTGLKNIVDSAQRSANSVREIVRASAEQGMESRMVVESIGKVAEMTRRMVNATQEQAKGSELINKASERMSEIAYKVKGSTRAQVEANEQITKTMEDFNRMVGHINNVIREQSRNIIKVLETAALVRKVSGENIKKAMEVDRAAEEMVRLNNELMGNVKRFKLKR